MFLIEPDEDHQHIVWWRIMPSSTWEDFANAIEGLKKEPLYDGKRVLIAHPQADMPKGAPPLGYIRRWFSTIEAHPSVDKLIIVFDQSLPIAKMFINIGMKVFRKEHVSVVGTCEEAIDQAGVFA